MVADATDGSQNVANEGVGGNCLVTHYFVELVQLRDCITLFRVQPGTVGLKYGGLSFNDFRANFA